MTHIIDQLVGGILNGNRFGTVMVRLKDVDNHSVGERPFATAVIHHAARGDKTHRTALAVGAPVIRIAHPQRLILVALEVARRLVGPAGAPATRLLRRPAAFGRRREREHVSLDLTELRGIGLIAPRWTAELLHFVVDALHAVLRAGMVREKLRRVPTLALRFDFLEKLRHRARVVTRVVEDLRA